MIGLGYVDDAAASRHDLPTGSTFYEPLARPPRLRGVIGFGALDKPGSFARALEVQTSRSDMQNARDTMVREYHLRPTDDPGFYVALVYYHALRRRWLDLPQRNLIGNLTGTAHSDWGYLIDVEVLDEDAPTAPAGHDVDPVFRQRLAATRAAMLVLEDDRLRALAEAIRVVEYLDELDELAGQHTDRDDVDEPPPPPWRLAIIDVAAPHAPTRCQGRALVLAA